MILLTAILTIIIISSIGFCLIKGCNLLPQFSSLSIIGFSYGFGVGLISLQMYFYSRINVPWTREFILAPWISILLLLLFLRKSIIPSFKFSFSLTKIQTFLLLGIIIAVVYVLFESILRPVSVWDSWAVWLQKSQIFFIDGHIRPAVLEYVRSDYPLIISLLGTFMYVMFGQVNDTFVLLAFFAFYLFLGLLFFSTIKDKFGTTAGLFFTLLLITLQTLVRQGGRFEAGQADLAIGYYTFACFIFLEEYLKTSSKRILFLLSVFSGFTGLTKFDGIPITIIIGLFVIIHFLRKKYYSHVFLLIFWIAPLVEWQIYKKENHLTFTYFAGHIFLFSFPTMLHVTWAEVKEFINIKSWSLLWFGYIYCLFAIPLRKAKEIFILHSIILSQIAIYTCLYFFTAGNTPESSFERLLVHIAPLAMYAIAIVFCKYLSPRTQVLIRSKKF